LSGYIRQDVTDQISNGNVIDAIPLDTEFDAITSAFASVGGHRHDGSVGEGAPVTVIGPLQDLVVTSSSVSPKTDNVLDLGAVGKEFKNLYITGVANIDSLVVDTADVNSGTIDATTIGVTTPSTGAFTTLSSSGVATLASALIGGVAVTTASVAQTLTNKVISLANNTLTTTSAQMAAAVTDETGSGALVFASSPVLTGVPTTPTATVNTNTTQIASTAFVVSQIADDAPTKTGTGASGSWSINAATASILQTARAINGVLFDGAANILTTLWGTARTITIGTTGKSVDGSVNVSWTLGEIGAQAVNSKLTGLSALSATFGMVVQTATNVFTSRSVDVGANTGVAISNGDGVSGNPTVSGVTQTGAVWNAAVSTTESVITPAKLFDVVKIKSIGWDQTWQNLSGSRAFSTAYLNNTGKPIMISVIASFGNVTGYTELYVDGLRIQSQYNDPDASNMDQTVSAIIPNGQTYQVSSTGTLNMWAEMR
jgi:hypothetical protein